MCVMCLERGASCDLGQVRPTFQTFSHEMKPRCRCPSRTPSGIGEGLLWLGFIHMDVFSQTRAVKGYNRWEPHSINSRQSRTPTKIKNTQQARESKQRRRRWAVPTAIRARTLPKHHWHPLGRTRVRRPHRGHGNPRGRGGLASHPWECACDDQKESKLRREEAAARGSHTESCDALPTAHVAPTARGGCRVALRRLVRFATYSQGRMGPLPRPSQ